MSDRIVLMQQGRIAQVGTPRDLYDRPATRYVADFIGETNLLPGVVVESGAGLVTLRVGEATLRGTSDRVPAPAAGSEAWLTVRPESIDLADGAAPGPGRNVVSGIVRDAVYAGSSLRVHVVLPSGQRLVANVPSDRQVALGAPASLTWAVEHGRCVGE